MTDIPQDHGSDRYNYVELQGAPEGVFPPDRFVDHLLSITCQDCNPNLFLKWVQMDAPIEHPRGLNRDWVDVHGTRWHLTIAHDEGCPTLAKIEDSHD